MLQKDTEGTFEARIALFKCNMLKNCFTCSFKN